MNRCSVVKANSHHVKVVFELCEREIDYCVIHDVMRHYLGKEDMNLKNRLVTSRGITDYRNNEQRTQRHRQLTEHSIIVVFYLLLVVTENDVVKMEQHSSSVGLIHAREKDDLKHTVVNWFTYQALLVFASQLALLPLGVLKI